VVLVFVVTCMVAAGLGLSARAVVAPLTRARLVALALVANFVAAPAIAYGLVHLIELKQPHEIGLLLLAGAAGAPFLPKLAGAAKGDVAFSVGLMLLLMVVSVGFVPLVLPLLIPGLAAEPWPLLRPLLFTMLVPLALGMGARERYPHTAERVRPAFVLVSNVSMVLALVLLIGLNFRAMLGTFGTGAVAVGVVFVALALVVGWVLGGPAPDTRSVLGLGTGQRNIAAALLIATQNFDDPEVVVMLLVTTVAGVFVLLGAARYFARGAAPSATGASAPAGESYSRAQELKP
jgi:BASS family bile acid:Na+ symporter